MAYLSRCRHVPRQVFAMPLSPPPSLAMSGHRLQAHSDGGDDRDVGRQRQGVSGLRLQDADKGSKTTRNDKQGTKPSSGKSHCTNIHAPRQSPPRPPRREVH